MELISHATGQQTKSADISDGALTAASACNLCVRNVYGVPAMAACWGEG